MDKNRAATLKNVKSGVGYGVACAVGGMTGNIIANYDRIDGKQIATTIAIGGGTTALTKAC